MPVGGTVRQKRKIGSTEQDRDCSDPSDEEDSYAPESKKRKRDPNALPKPKPKLRRSRCGCGCHEQLGPQQEKEVQARRVVFGRGFTPDCED